MAAILSIHAKPLQLITRADTGKIDWNALRMIHQGLAQLYPTRGNIIAYAAAAGEDLGAEKGLAILEALPSQEFSAFQPFHAARAKLLRALDREDEVQTAYQRAIDFTPEPPVRRWLVEEAAKPSAG